ncbi:hypothetical protein DJ021_13915 [Phenylobacterium hankyongense]|uniref:Uncharacterized protein n=1 Tax=Phenylobacterium hankyongense TaxID=1813876 RepID=A0A328B1Z6_9CAUL|nr:hypothetical protein DJ021_13915 [Phenylobacterium hankyongense]
MIRQTWLLSDDPRTDQPEIEVLATRRTASEAADVAREAALAFRRHGFHKPSGCWWGADEARFHRFSVRGQSPRATASGIAVALAALATVAIIVRRPRKGARAQS